MIGSLRRAQQGRQTSSSQSAVRGVLRLSGMDLPVSLMNWPLATEKQGSGGSKRKSSFFTTKLELVGVLQGAFLWLPH